MLRASPIPEGMGSLQATQMRPGKSPENINRSAKGALKMAKQVDTILFTSNLSETSRVAFGQAAFLAAQLNAKLILLHVLESVPGSYESRMRDLFGEDKWNEILLSHKEEARHALIGKITERQMACTALSQFCREADTGSADGRDCTAEDQIVVIEGEIVATILQQAEEHHCDLIVMGASKGLLSGTSVGHNIKTILKKSKIPTLVIPTGQPR
jgi:nucleotide-binding universal stress UspA family protein